MVSGAPMVNDKLNIPNMGVVIKLMEDAHKAMFDINSTKDQLSNIANQMSNFVNTKTISVITNSLYYLGLEETKKRYILACGEAISKMTKIFVYHCEKCGEDKKLPERLRDRVESYGCCLLCGIEKNQ